ncbi:(deoxy)nucleoside triphosphate pyrophosphohydrolase [Mesobacillus foraminis]|uniref:8-oxo-dGTP diphosphatase n=1 Tax=Mesobacillus foraminis TaxID=279826 RepID=A0A4R2B6Q3_9BACI|nr:(deoxy)nucleoside triphosphate pyrophosphohydrolase [Mesobacillus foraminis]TCN22378.1 8-oxo-dGTP diphosphatase [Mesobacillus foraminis]
MKKQIKVVGAVIENGHKEILCALRSPQMSMPNMWEFPGGKVEKDEDIFSALTREIHEELSCKISTLNLLHENVYEYDDFIIQLLTIRCRIATGIPIPGEHSKLIWLKRENLASLVWAPADIPAVELLIAEKIQT